MGSKELLILFVFAIASFLSGLLQAQSTENFVSLDCGLAANQNYIDENGISWVSDATYISTGKTAVVSFITGNSPFNSLRFFDGGRSKYCYQISDLVPGTYYLVRPSFYYGNYDNLNTKTFTFAFIIDSQSWDINIVSLFGIEELFVPARSSSMSICLATGNGSSTPFISSLELRPLPNTLPSVGILKNQWGSRTFLRYDYGASANAILRYPKDRLDRYWFSIFESLPLKTTSLVTTSTISMVPQEVLQTAMYNISITVNPQNTALSSYFIAFYFAEISLNVQKEGDRVFDIYRDSSTTAFVSNIDIFKSVGKYELYYLATFDQPIKILGSTTFYFIKRFNSTYGPIISGMELMELTEKPLELGTFHADVMALEDVKNSLNLESWMGDPCLPIKFDWLNCTSGSNIQINALSLSNQNLQGTLSPSLNSLTALEIILLNGNKLNGTIPDLSQLKALKYLDLSNNSLYGSIPDWLATLPNLKSLSLQNNSFTGTIPNGLLMKRDARTLNFTYDNFTKTLAEPMPPNSTVNTTTGVIPKENSPMQIIIAAVIGGVAFLAIILVIIIAIRTRCCRNIRKPRESTVNTEITNPPEAEMSKISTPRSGNSDFIGPEIKADVLTQFTYDEMQKATNNFKTKIAKGGSGTVYLGTHGKHKLAVKKLSFDQHYVFKMFMNEVEILSKVHHANLVPLIGYCREVELMLVFKCMENGTLRDYLYGKNKGKPLSWKTRLLIALGAAEGLDYLHTKCQPRHIHRDVKSENILLDDNLRAKVSDFGISRSRPEEDGASHHTQAMGTKGYADPEMIETGNLTEKSDVYSFGVVLLEILCGRSPTAISCEGKESLIVPEVRQHVVEQNLLDVVDPWLTTNRSYNEKSMWVVANIALTATLKKGTDRPSMKGIIASLNEALSNEFGNEIINYEQPLAYNF